jgi:hypothetical protein
MSNPMHDQWLEARQRLFPGIEAALWEAFRASSPARQQCVAVILDRVLQKEYKRALSANWAVWISKGHTDIIVQDDLSYESANALAQELRHNNGHAHFWCAPACEPAR